MKKLCLTIVCFFTSLLFVSAQNLEGTVIFINPGHGGFDSDDRNVVIYPYQQGDPNGFWESQSNLDKAFALKGLLEATGATVFMSRTANTTADDLSLSLIVAMANDSEADFMLSIHSNAGGGAANHVLQLYAGKDETDPVVYPTPTPYSDESRAICKIIAADQYSNQANSWAANYTVIGDKTFGRLQMGGWSDGYGVLRGLLVPGCISEGSMHDYIPETYRLMNMDYKWLEAWHFLKSFATYFKGGEIPTGNIVGTIHDSRNLNMANYTKLPGKDRLLPLHGARVTVNPGNHTYTTDVLYNGVYVIKNLSPGTYEVLIEAEGYTPDTLELEVKANTVTYYNALLNMLRNTPPEVIGHSPDVSLEELVLCSTPILFKFNWDVDVESAIQAFSITPAVEGTVTFEDSQHRMIFTPGKPYEVNTVYTVKLSTALKHPADIHLQADFVFEFKTDGRNRLTFLDANPKEEDRIHYLAPVFDFRFDKLLDAGYAGIRDAIKILDLNGTELEKVSRSIRTNHVAAPYGSQTFNLLNDLTPGKTYRVRMGKDVIDNTGIYLVDPIEYTFQAVDVRVTDKPVVETFETTGVFSYIAGSGTQVTSASYTRSNSPKLFDSYAGKFSYVFSHPSGGKVYYSTTNRSVTVDSEKALGLHLYGDLTGNTLYLAFQAADNETVEIKLGTLDFIGWKFVETDLKALTPGKDFTLVGFNVVQEDKPFAVSGGFSADNLLVYDELINSIGTKRIPGLTVDQSSGKLKAISATHHVLSMELFAVTGKMLNRVAATEMNIAYLSPGIYVVKIVLEDGQVEVRKILIGR